MFKNMGFGLGNEALLLGLIGVGLYAQNNEINLANNTTILLLLFMLFLEDQKVEELSNDFHCHYAHHHRPFVNNCSCSCGCNNNVIHFRQPFSPNANRFYGGQDRCHNNCGYVRNNYCC